MSHVGDRETTPAATKPERPPGNIAGIALKVHNAVYNPPSDCIQLHAEARPTFSDGRVEAGIPLAFFLNGDLIVEIETDEFGLAVVKCDLARHHYRKGTNLLTARVRGFSTEAQLQLSCSERLFAFKRIVHRWNRIIQVKRYYTVPAETYYDASDGRGYYQPSTTQNCDYQRFEDLTLRIDAEVTSPPWSIEGVLVEVQAYGQDGAARVLASSKFDSQGTCSLRMSQFFFDDPNVVSAIQKNITCLHGSTYYNCSYASAPAALPPLNNLWGLSLIVYVPAWPKTFDKLDVSRQGDLIPTAGDGCDTTQLLDASKEGELNGPTVRVESLVGFGADDVEYFSEQEAQQITAALDALPSAIHKQFAPTPDQFARISSTIAETKEAVRVKTKVDWKRIFLAALVQVSVDLGFGSTIPQVLISLVKTVLTEFLNQKLLK